MTNDWQRLKLLNFLWINLSHVNLRHPFPRAVKRAVKRPLRYAESDMRRAPRQCPCVGCLSGEMKFGWGGLVDMIWNIFF